MGGLIVRRKAIKYKKDFFCYLSFYLDLGLQAACFQILSFRPHTFKSFPLGRMLLKFFPLGHIPLGLLTKYIHLSFGS